VWVKGRKEQSALSLCFIAFVPSSFGPLLYCHWLERVTVMSKGGKVTVNKGEGQGYARLSFISLTLFRYCPMTWRVCEE